MRLPEGRIHYLGLKSWMGYRVDYDPTRPWLLAACLLAVLSITWFFLNKFRRTPWDRGSME
jgi:cytochrome c biogenesis protein